MVMLKYLLSGFLFCFEAAVATSSLYETRRGHLILERPALVRRAPHWNDPHGSSVHNGSTRSSNVVGGVVGSSASPSTLAARTRLEHHKTKHVKHSSRRNSAGSVGALPQVAELGKTRGDVSCEFTIDNWVDTVYYNKQDVTGQVTDQADFRDWTKAKSITVTPVGGAYLVVSGEETDASGSCAASGFAMVCTNGVTAATAEAVAGNAGDHIKGEGAGWAEPCVSTSGFSLTGNEGTDKKWTGNDKIATFRVMLQAPDPTDGGGDDGGEGGGEGGSTAGQSATESDAHPVVATATLRHLLLIVMSLTLTF